MTSAQLAPPVEQAGPLPASPHGPRSAAPDRVAASAARLVRRMPGVRAARVDVREDAVGLALHARITLDPRADFSATVTRIMDRVVPDMERALGAAFVTHHVDFALDSTSRDDHAATTSVLTII